MAGSQSAPLVAARVAATCDPQLLITIAAALEASNGGRVPSWWLCDSSSSIILGLQYKLVTVDARAVSRGIPPLESPVKPAPATCVRNQSLGAFGGLGVVVVDAAVDGGRVMLQPNLIKVIPVITDALALRAAAGGVAAGPLEGGGFITRVLCLFQSVVVFIEYVVLCTFENNGRDQIQ